MIQVRIMPSKRPIRYPFMPRSTSSLVPGQFWAIPLRDGSFGCGRVIETQAQGGIGSRVIFLAAVLDWHSTVPPTLDSIAGAKCLDQGKLHLKAITEEGGCILGHRPLELDDIEPWEFRGAVFHANCDVLKGLQPVRAQQPSDERLPVLCGWGSGVPVVIAEARFLKRARRKQHR